jgi:DNA-binding phage protein
MQNLDELKEVLGDFKPAAIARSTGLSRQTIYNVLNGTEPNPKTDTIVRLHKYLVSYKARMSRFLETNI